MCRKNPPDWASKPASSSLQGGQRRRVLVSAQLKCRVVKAPPHPRYGLGFSPDGPFGALDPRLRLFQPALPGQHGAERHVGGDGGWLAGPAVQFGQFDRLPAVIGGLRERSHDLDCRQVRQASELQVRASDPPRQHDTLVQVPLCLLELARPHFWAVKSDQCQGAEVLAQTGLGAVVSLGYLLQSPCLSGHRGQIAALAGQQQPSDPQQQVRLGATAFGHRRHAPPGQAQKPLRSFHRSVSELIGCGHHDELGVGRTSLRGEPGEQLTDGSSPPVKTKTGPVISQQPRGHDPVLRRLRVPDRLYRVSVPSQPPGRYLVQRAHLARRGASQLEVQEVGEQLVEAKPGPPRGRMSSLANRPSGGRPAW